MQQFLDSFECSAAPVQRVGEIIAARGALLRAHLPSAEVGGLCTIMRPHSAPLPAQVVAFDERGAYLAPFDSIRGIAPGSEVLTSGKYPNVRLTPAKTQTVIDCLGFDLSENHQPDTCFDLSAIEIPLEQPPPTPLSKPPIHKRLFTGVHTIDLFSPIGLGQRIGIFSGPGTGKSTLLRSIVSRAEIQRVVIALVGERGREAGELANLFLKEASGKKITIVVATSDESAVRRRAATYTATSIAEYHREQGEDVLLVVDSLTRTARSIRDLTLSAGEFPVRQGYTSSVFEELPQLIERTGTSAQGTITAIYTVLTSTHESSDILAEEIKSLLDGHINLDPLLAKKGVWPAVDPIQSLSRLTQAIQPKSELHLASLLREILSRLAQEKDLVMLGGEPDPLLKRYIELEPHLQHLFTQKSDSSEPFADFLISLGDLLQQFEIPLMNE